MPHTLAALSAAFWAHGQRLFTAAAAAGQLPDASASEVKTMNRRLAVFHDLTNGQVLRSCWFV